MINASTMDNWPRWASEGGECRIKELASRFLYLLVLPLLKWHPIIFSECHWLRPYGAGMQVITYSRPPGFSLFPPVQEAP